MMNPASLGFDFAATSAAASSAAAAAAAASQHHDSGADHLQRLAAMTQGVGKDDNDSATPSADALYPGYMGGYGAWPNYYPQFGQPLASAATAFGAWPAQCYAAPHWPNYAQSKKGRQTYQRYQTSVLESKFQQSSYVSKKQREELRLQTNLTDRQIKIWFQNRRMKAKKEKHRMDEQGDMAVPLLPNTQKGHSSADEEEKKWQQQCGGGAPFAPANGAPPQWGAMGAGGPPGAYAHYPVCPPNI